MEITEALKRKVWEKGRIVNGFNPEMYRKDACGAWMVWDKYGVTDNMYGWQIDHIYPVNRLKRMDVSDEEIWDLKNLRPLQHQNNASKADDYPSYTSVVTADGKRNINKEANLVVNEKIRELLREFYQL